MRWDCVRSPWIIAAANPSRTRCLARRSVPCLVRAKTNVWPFSAWKKQTQNFQLFRIRHFEGLEFDGVRRPRDGTNSHSHGLVHVIVYQVGDRGFQSGREAQCLALARQRRYDAANGRQEAHVEHAVGFIQKRALRGFDPNPPLAHSCRWEQPHASIVQLDFSDSNRSQCHKSTRHAFIHAGRCC